MIVTKITVGKEDSTEKELNVIKQFSNKDFTNVDVIFKLKIVGRKKLEFYILGSTNSVVADLTNKTVQKISDFKCGTAVDFSKTLVKNWDKLCYYEDGNFKI